MSVVDPPRPSGAFQGVRDGRTSVASCTIDDADNPLSCPLIVIPRTAKHSKPQIDLIDEGMKSKPPRQAMRAWCGLMTSEFIVAAPGMA